MCVHVCNDCSYVCLFSMQIEARSVDNLKKLNKGMENKIIELQQKLTEQVTPFASGPAPHDWGRSLAENSLCFSFGSVCSVSSWKRQGRTTTPLS